MGYWNHPPDINYSFKSHFNWTPPVPEAAATAAASEAATNALPHGAPTGGGGYGGGPWGRGHHGYGYGRGYYCRPRFGLFRRMVWFGLGVGAASWYIHRNDPANRAGRCISDRAGQLPSTHENTSRPSNDPHTWRSHWQYSYPPDTAKLSTPTPPSARMEPAESKVLASLPTVQVQRDLEQPRQWGWGARRAERRRNWEEAATATTITNGSAVGEVKGGNADYETDEEVRKISEAVDKIWAERKQAAVEIQAQANEKAKEYARVKLETLSQAVDTLRDALRADAGKAARDPKLV